ncbi:MAG: DUF2071 domain-containing protein [Leptospirales bacterium]|nr:DUF2071 domain-containing protein [Leptospirales bacterium]
MLHLLRRHPFAVRAHFDYSAVLTYALPANILQPLLPPGLELDQREGLGFAAIAMVKTRRLRPAVFPALLGQDFFLIGYRIFSRFTTREGRRLRGLRILRSETDRRRMVCSGNLLTHYHYHYAPIHAAWSEENLHVVREGGMDVVFHKKSDARLPSGSPFADWREARMYAGPLPFTFDYEQETHSIVIIEGVRQNWTPQAVEAEVRTLDFFDQPQFQGVRPQLCSAFIVENIPFMWKKGRRELLNAQSI